MKIITITTSTKVAFVDITKDVQEAVNATNIQEGIIVVQSFHTTAGLTINENADPAVKRDMKKGLRIFDRDDYEHSEGNSDAHLKTTVVGPSLSIIIHQGKLLLGTWQGIYLAEFDGPRKRKIGLQIIGKEKTK